MLHAHQLIVVCVHFGPLLGRLVKRSLVRKILLGHNGVLWVVGLGGA